MVIKYTCTFLLHNICCIETQKMGCSFSCIRLPVFSSKSSKLNSSSSSIKVIHFDGHIEHLDPPVTVSEVTGYPSKHLMFTHSQLLSSCSTPLKFNAPLEPGSVYFLLPCTLFGSNVSPIDLAPITRKLVALARSKSKSGARSVSSSVGSSSPVWSSPGRSPGRLSAERIGVRIRMENDQVFCGSPKSGTWKPILATITEKSLNQRSESDLLNDVKVDMIY